LDDLVHQGKARYLGCSNLAAWQVVEALWTSWHHGLKAFVSCQDEYSLLVRGIERDRLPVAQAYRVGVLPFFPLASGLLTGKYRRDAEPPQGTRLKNTPYLANLYMTPLNWTRVEGLTAFCQARGRWLKAPEGTILASNEPESGECCLVVRVEAAPTYKCPMLRVEPM
ncbi:MAG: aldo/keto reductase, partial [Alphaproteobacteria bacterium]|nr:aldo/keto reductase [Alphaproteobacteria bacterium]